MPIRATPRWGVSLLGLALSLAVSSPAAAAAPVTDTFASPGETTFTVPAKVTSLQITARGAGGGAGQAPGDVGAVAGAGGSGSQITGTLAVTPGEVLTLAVGQRGADAPQGGTGNPCRQLGGAGGTSSAAGQGGGGHGGEGDSSVCSAGGGGGGGGSATTVTLSGSSTIIIAGGGGGGGGGGAIVGFNGGGGGSGGTGTTGGAGGSGTNAGGGGGRGAAPTIQGTDGGSSCDACSAGAGGGGGGGAQGGGGGGAGRVGGGGGGGGGAGTDLVSSSLSNPTVSVSPSGAGADGLVTITYTPPDSTSTAVSCTAVVVDQQATCTATVTDTETANASTPTGTVSFESNGSGSFGADSCTLSQASPGVARCAVAYTPSAIAAQTISADYGGDPTHTESSGSQALSVDLRSARTSMSCSPNPVATGRETTCTVTVTDTSPGTVSTPTGSVGIDLTSGGSGSFGSDTCTSLRQTSPGVASCSVTYTPSAVDTGSRQFLAQYGGDSKHAGNLLSIGFASVTVIAARSTSTSVSCSPDTAAVGTPSSCTATVTDTGGGTPSAPTGKVSLASNGPGSFSDDQCTLEQTSPGVAGCSVTYTPAAEGAPTSTDTITASYGGDSTRADSSGTAAVTVQPTSTADCKNRGWRNYGFPNQRQCVLFVEFGGLPETAACAGQKATIVGTRGADKLRGTKGDDVIVTGDGDDRVLGSRGDDLVCGGAGADVIRGGRGADTLRGGPGKDGLRGGPGSNECRGGRGSDDQRHC